MIGKLVSVLAGLAFLAITGAANATIIWSASGLVGPLVTGSDNEELESATLTLSIEVDPGVYGDYLGIGFFGFAPIAAGDITISGSGVPVNNATWPLEPFPGGVAPIGYTPNFPGVSTSNGWPVAITLPSDNILTLAHSFFPATPSGAGVLPGDPISIDDFPVGLPDFATYTVAIQTADPNIPVSAQYESTFATYTAVKSPNGVPEPSGFALIALGLAGIGFSRKRMKA